MPDSGDLEHIPLPDVSKVDDMVRAKREARREAALAWRPSEYVKPSIDTPKRVPPKIEAQPAMPKADPPPKRVAKFIPSI